MSKSNKEVLNSIQANREDQVLNLRKIVMEYKKKCEKLESQICLALNYLEDGAEETAKRVLLGGK